MKKIVLALIVCLWACRVDAAILSATAQDLSGSSITSLQTSGSMNVPTGATILAHCDTSSSSSTHSAPTDTAGNTFTDLSLTVTGLWGKSSWWIVQNATGNAADQVTCNWTSSPYDAVIAFADTSASASSNDVTFSSSAQTDTVLTSDAFTTTNATDTIFACSGAADSGYTYSSPTIGGSAATLVTTAASAHGQDGCGYLTVASTQTSITAVIHSSNAWPGGRITGVAIKEGGGGVVARPCIIGGGLICDEQSSGDEVAAPFPTFRR